VLRSSVGGQDGILRSNEDQVGGDEARGCEEVLAQEMMQEDHLAGKRVESFDVTYRALMR
jgi:hypothetical protein